LSANGNVESEELLYFDNSSASYFMAIVNVTPDSFSDGGDFATPDAALQQVAKLVRD